MDENDERVPTIHRERGFRFFFFSNERGERPHVHVEAGGGYAKFWLDPVDLAYCIGLKASEVRRARLIVIRHRLSLRRGGVSISVPHDPRAERVDFRGEQMVVVLADGRSLTVPLEWFPKLRAATAAQRGRWQLMGRGVGIHWPDLDEDISVEALLTPGIP